MQQQLLLSCLLFTCCYAGGTERLLNPTPETTYGNSGRYQFEIDQHAAEYGPFDAQLSEMYLEMGQSLHHSGNHSAASEVLIKALQVSRVNYGLYNIHQEKIIRALIDSLSALGSHQQIPHYHQQLTQLNNRLLDNGFSVALAPNLLNSSRWYLDLYHQFPSGFTAPYLRTSIRLAQAAQTTLANHYGPHHPTLIKPLQQIAESNYHLTRYYQRLIRFFGTGGQSLNRFGQEQSFQHGLQSYRQIIAIHKHNQPPAKVLAMAQIALGDYLQLFQQQSDAHIAYVDAWNTLDSAGDTSSTKQLLGKPILLPVFEQNTYAPPKAVAKIKADIDHTGKAHNIEILETYPANSQQVANTAQTVTGSAIFRNPVIGGKISDGRIEFSLPLR